VLFDLISVIKNKKRGKLQTIGQIKKYDLNKLGVGFSVQKCYNQM